VINLLFKVKDKVGYLLNRYPETRDCDATLYCYYLATFHNLNNEIGSYNCRKLLTIIKTAPVPESMRRVRQKFQEEGVFLGTMRGKRLEMEKGVREGIGAL
jgi:hypothetical protein